MTRRYLIVIGVPAAAAFAYLWYLIVVFAAIRHGHLSAMWDGVSPHSHEIAPWPHGWSVVLVVVSVAWLMFAGAMWPLSRALADEQLMESTYR